jgi:uncharacterized membrane protein
MTQSEDPFDAPYWNLCQTRLWIGYRNPELVREYEVEPVDGIAGDLLYDSFPKQRVCQNFSVQLLTALQSGAIQCFGLMNGKGCPTLIAAHEWRSLVFKDVGGPRATPAGAPRTGSVMWAGLGFPSKEVRAEWPDPTSASIQDPITDETNSFWFTGDYWLITFEGQTRTLKNTKGIRYIAYLIQNQGKEVHVSDLYYAINPPDANAINTTHSSMTAEQLGGMGLSISDLGDAGDVLTPESKRRLQQAIRQLNEQIKEAAEMGDEDKQEILEEKKDNLIEYISTQSGLGGKPRKASSGIERIRKAVSKRIRGDINKLRKTFPDLDHHLKESLNTGIQCHYSPHPPIQWIFKAE